MNNIVIDGNLPINIREVATAMLGEHLTPVPVAFRGKNPTVPGWQTYTHERVTGEMDQLFPEGRKLNVGLLLGAASGGIVDIDLDWLLAGQLAPMFLPATRVFGRAGAARSHYLYFVDGGVAPAKLSPPRKPPDGFKPDILEVRADGQQTVWPGSTHVSGEAIEWANPDVPIARIQAEELVAVAEQLAVATWVASVWGEGSRDELCAALAGGILRDGAIEADVTHFLDAVMMVAKDEEARDRLKKVSRIAGDLFDGSDKKHFGWPKVAELLGSKEADWVRKRLRSICFPVDDGQGVLSGQSDDVVAKLNEKYAVIMVGGRAAILHEQQNPSQDRIDVVLTSPTDLRLVYDNKHIPVQGGNGTRMTNPINVWLRHPSRREYSGMVFAPDRQCPGDYYNLWRGFALEPSPGECSRYLDHIRGNIAAGNLAHYDWIVGWMADAVQNPTRRPGVSIVLRGGQGTGKGSFANHFGALFGQHYVHVSSPRHLLGNFNAHLKDALIVFADEAFWAGDKAAEGVLKSMVTEPTQMIEYKGKDVISVQNHIRIIAASNHDWVVPAGFDERRFAVFDVGDRHKQDHSYFGTISTEMQNGGLAALLHYLMHFDLAAVDLRRIPQTSALSDNKLRSADPIVRWWAGALEAGAQLPDSEAWLPEVVCKVLWESFKEATRDGRQYSPSREHSSVFGKELMRLCPGMSKSNARKDSGRVWHYCFPALDVCLESFERVTGIKIEQSGSGAVSDAVAFPETAGEF
jgi:hypothetical protein